MKKNNLSLLFAFLIFLGLTIVIFQKFFLQGMYPFPGNFQLAWFEPWKTYSSVNEVLGIPHKPIADDIFRQLYPFKVLAIDMFKQHTLPLWNPYNGAGMPLLATMHVGYLNPFNLLFFVFDNPTAWSLQVIIQVLLIGTGTYIYSRKIKLSQNASLFSSVTFMLSGFVISRSIYNDYNYAVACIPILLYLLECLFENMFQKKIFFVPLVCAFLFFVTQPQIIMYVLLYILAYAFVLGFEKQLAFSSLQSRSLLTTLLLLGIGVGLAAMQLFPTAELFMHSAISPNSSTFIFERFLLPWQHLITLVIPNYFGNQATYNYWGAGDYVESMLAVGTISCFFAFISLFARHTPDKKRKYFFAATILVTVLLSFKWFGTSLLYSLPLPILATGIPSRMFFLTVFSLSILAGMGYDVVFANKSNRSFSKKPMLIFSSIITAITVITIIAFIVKFPCNNPVITECRTIALRNTGIEVSIYIAMILIVCSYFFIKKKFIKQAAQVSVFVLVIVIGLYNSSKFLPFSSREAIMPSNPLIAFLQQHTTDGRVLGMGEAAMQTDFASYYQYLDPNYYDPLYNKRYGELIAYANTGRSDQVLRSDIRIHSDASPSAELAKRRQRVMELLSITYLIYKDNEPLFYEKHRLWSDGHFSVVKNIDSLPRAYFVSNVQVKKTDHELLTTLFQKNFRASDTALIEKPLIKPVPNTGSKSKIVNADYRNNHVSIKTTTDKDSFLVVTDNYFPGWKAYIDGEETEIFRTNYTLRGIVIPKGNHDVLFTYKPSSFRFGVYCTLFFSSMYLLLFFFWPKVRRNKKN